MLATTSKRGRTARKLGGEERISDGEQRMIQFRVSVWLQMVHPLSRQHHIYIY